MSWARIIRIGIASAAMLLVAAVSTAQGQSYAYRWDNGAGNNNWGTGQNWGLNPPQNLGVNNVTPNAFFEEQGLINNGNTVNVTTSQTQFSSTAADNAAAAAGVTVDGVTAPGNGSTLNIASTGNLSLLITYGPNGAPPSATPTAGTGNANLNNGGVITVQPGGTLTAQGDIIINNGRLAVGGAGAGGQVSAGNLRAPNANGTVNLSGSAVVNLKNGAVLNGTTTITGPNVVFNTPSISMSAAAVFNPVITSPAVAAGTGHSVINVTGGVSLNGTLRPQFQNGVVPQLGDTWTLWDSAQVQGNFTASDATAPGCWIACRASLRNHHHYGGQRSRREGAVDGREFSHGRSQPCQRSGHDPKHQHHCRPGRNDHRLSDWFPGRGASAGVVRVGVCRHLGTGQSYAEFDR